MKFQRTTIALAAVGTLLLAGCSANGGNGGGSDSDEYSASGTIRMVVAMAAGGGSDRAGRVMSSAVNEGAQGYSTVVENREGGGGAVGWSYFSALSGQPGHLLVAETALHTLPRQDGVDVPFTYEDFTPIALFAEDSRMVVAPVDFPFDTCAEVIEASASNDFSAGVSGTFGADGMVLTELENAGLDADRVPFGSTGEVVTGLLGGQIDFAPASAAAVKPYIESGDFKGLCTMTEDRYADDEVLADVGTAVEQGIDAVVVLWRGVLAPADISDAAEAFWIEEMQKALQTEGYKDYIETDLLIENQLFGDDFAAYLDEYDTVIEGYFE
ncbi:tripartite tricarboxylate transporter substrate binding protein [Humidisolicoccus flavus]|uniref:tripartite tricarboxylate transporter substrate binding protein n=1 Tax=Humidisolicoccus flavus TaxID=3111414 RepID=UPI0032504E05